MTSKLQVGCSSIVFHCFFGNHFQKNKKTGMFFLAMKNKTEIQRFVFFTFQFPELKKTEPARDLHITYLT